eukprot:332704_1
MINQHNQRGLNYTLSLNQCGDLSVEEFQYQIHGHVQPSKPKPKYKKQNQSDAPFAKYFINTIQSIVNLNNAFLNSNTHSNHNSKKWIHSDHKSKYIFRSR